MTIEEMNATLLGLGLKRTYRPRWDHETGTIELETRKPARIVDGGLVGSDICLTPKRMREGVFRVWTGKRMKAKRTAAAHKITARLLDGEAELFVPAALADQILPLFGAKVKRQYSQEALEAAKARMEIASNALNLRQNTNREGVFGL